MDQAFPDDSKIKKALIDFYERDGQPIDLPDDEAFEIRKCKPFVYSFVEWEAIVEGTVFGQLEVDTTRVDFDWDLRLKIKPGSQRVSINEPIEVASETRAWARKEGGKSIPRRIVRLAFRVAYENDHLDFIDKERTANSHKGEINRLKREVRNRAKDKTESRVSRDYSPASRRLRYRFDISVSYRAFQVSGFFVKIYVNRKAISGFVFYDGVDFSFYPVSYVTALEANHLERYLFSGEGCLPALFWLSVMLIAGWVYLSTVDETAPTVDEANSIDENANLEPASPDAGSPPPVQNFPEINADRLVPSVEDAGSQAQMVVVPARLIESRSPSYPRRALQRGVEGAVVVRLDVDERGFVENIRIVRSEPTGIFDQSVISAVEGYRYSPRLENEKPVAERNVEISFEFNLEE